MNKILDIIISFQEIALKVIHLYHPATFRKNGLKWGLGVIAGTLVLICIVLAQIWGQEPQSIEPAVLASSYVDSNSQNKPIVTGYTTSVTLKAVILTLMNKSGGYLTNDVIPPSIFMDNIPNWEKGVIIQIRDLARSLRNDMGRSQTQSIENKFLSEAETRFSISNNSWMLPATESEYLTGVEYLDKYIVSLQNPDAQQTQFYARADNLNVWLGLVEKRLGSLSQRLSASVSNIRVNTDLAGDSQAIQSTQTSSMQTVKTPWLEIDDVFYEARGSVWALVAFLKAIEIDFNNVLEKKNALISIRQIIRELESAQQPIWSPIVMNGSGFGLTANYSLVMASYISRANAAIIDLRNLLNNG